MPTKEDWYDFWYNSEDVKPKKKRKTIKFNPLVFALVLETLMIVILLTLI